MSDEPNEPNSLQPVPESKPRVARPVGVTIAALLIMFSAAMGVTMLLLAFNTSMTHLLGFSFPVVGIVVALGLLWQKPWAYWATVVLIGIGLIMTISRLLGLWTFRGALYDGIRLMILGAWVWYFSLPGVRRSFI